MNKTRAKGNRTQYRRRVTRMRLLKTISALLSVKVRQKQGSLYICRLYQLTSLVYQLWQTRADIKDRSPLQWICCICQECFAPFRECSIIIFIDQLSTTTSHYSLLISLRPTAILRSICSLLRTATHDTLVMKLKLITRSDNNRPLMNYIPNNKQQCLV